MRAGNGRRSRRLILTMALVLAAAVLIGLWLRFPSGRFHGAVNARVGALLKSRFGPGTEIETVYAEWTSLTLNGLTVPLDQRGSRLRVRTLEIALSPLDILLRPGQIERSIRSVLVIGPEVTVIRDRSEQRGDSHEPWVPNLTVQPRTYEALGHLDSLHRVEVQHGRLYLGDGTTPPRLVCEVDGNLAHADRGALQLLAKGHCLGDSSWGLSLTGTLDPRERSLSLQAILNVPKGRLTERRRDTPEITCDGGRVSVRMSAVDSVTDVSGGLALNGVCVATPAGAIRIEALRGTLNRDTLWVAPSALTSQWFEGEMSGRVVLRGRGALDFDGNMRAGDLSRWGTTGTASPLSGSLRCRVHVAGDTKDPQLDLSVDGSDLGVYGARVSEARVEATVTPEGAEICSLNVATDWARARFSGEIALGDVPRWNLEGSATLGKAPAVLGWSSDVRSIRVQVLGPVGDPEVRTRLLGDDGKLLGEAVTVRNGDVWQLDFESGTGEPARVEYRPAPDGIHVTATQVQRLMEALFSASRPTLRAVRALQVRFAGDARRGDLELDAQVEQDTSLMWTQMAREFHFRGRYARDAGLRSAIDGQWSGTTGEGERFEGRADLTLADQIVTVNQIFVDVAGTAKGTVNLRDRSLDLELTVSDLPLARLPIKPAFVRRGAMTGTLDGHVRMTGAFAEPEWTASLSLTDGTILGLSDYWANLDASGRGLRAELRSFELGREVRKIADVHGTVDLRGDSLALQTTVQSARAEDFFQTLTGRGGLLSGEMTGHGSVSGSLSRPDVEAEIHVQSGKLLDQIAVDDFTASLGTAESPTGDRVVRIEKCEFGKTNRYLFDATAEFVAKRGGDVQVQVKGSGDLLDIVDQLDRTFTGAGSEGTVRFELGGTLDRLRLIGGELSVRNGRFSYTDATPGELETEIGARISPAGEVDSGRVVFRSGAEWIELRAVPGGDTLQPGLMPLMIANPYVRLGVLEIRTGADGMPLRLPGFMRPDWTGIFRVGAGDEPPLTLSDRGQGRLLISGNVSLRNARMTFPFYSSGRGGRMKPVARWLVDRLREAEWDVDVTVESANHYDVEITGLKNSSVFAPWRDSPIFKTLADYLDHVTIDAMLDPSENPLKVGGCLDEGTFHLVGRITSSRGKVDYLDQSFTIDHVVSDFDETSVMPILEGRARTEGVDSLGRRVPVYLTMYQIDRETDTRQKRGRLGNMTFVLEGETGETPEQVMQLLGYDLQDVRSKAEQVVASSFVRAIGRQWLDPLERRLERWTLLDEIAFTPAGGRSTSLFRQQRLRAEVDSLRENRVVSFLTGSQVTVGKYVTRDLFLTYTGELSEGQIETGSRLGLIHSWNLEYRMDPLSPDLVLDLAVQYDEIQHRRDEAVSLKYFFVLEP